MKVKMNLLEKFPIHRVKKLNTFFNFKKLILGGKLYTTHV